MKFQGTGMEVRGGLINGKLRLISARHHALIPKNKLKTKAPGVLKHSRSATQRFRAYGLHILSDTQPF